MSLLKLARKHKFFIIMGFLAFLVYSFYFNSFGADAPLMMEYYNINEAGQGFIATMQAVGGIVVAVFLALYGERFNKIHVITLGVLLISIACIFMGFAPAYAVLIIIVLVAGLGYSAVDVMMNSVISDVYPKQKSTLLPWSHAFFGLGAMVAPAFVAGIANPAEPFSWRLPFLYVGIAGIVICIVYALAGRKIMPETPYAHMEKLRAKITENPIEIFKKGKAWMFLIVGTLYFCFQLGMINWLPTFYLRNTDVGFEMAGVMSTMLFAGALVMRFMGPLFLKKMTARSVYVIFTFISGILMMLSFVIPIFAVRAALTVAAGFLQGSSVVTLIIMCCDEFPTRTASASAIVVLSANIATLTFPVLMGKIAETTGFLFPMFLAAGVLILSAIIILIGVKKVPLATKES
ncbi:MAG: MFS transporter [Christensenellaceae bacterium]|jgi:fucose permease